MAATHIADRGERPGLLSLPLLFPWSIAPFISSRMALARELRVGLPMEAVVYRGMLFSAIEAWKAKSKSGQCETEESGSALSSCRRVPFKGLSSKVPRMKSACLPGRQQRGSDHSPGWSGCSSLRLDCCEQNNEIRNRRLTSHLARIPELQYRISQGEINALCIRTKQIYWCGNVDIKAKLPRCAIT